MAYFNHSGQPLDEEYTRQFAPPSAQDAGKNYPADSTMTYSPVTEDYAGPDDDRTVNMNYDPAYDPNYDPAYDEDGSDPYFDDDVPEDELYDDELYEEELAAERRHRFRILAGVSDLAATLFGVAAILALVAFLSSMLRFVSSDFVQNFSLWVAK